LRELSEWWLEVRCACGKSSFQRAHGFNYTALRPQLVADLLAWADGDSHEFSARWIASSILAPLIRAASEREPAI
jgi:hypothetical protein